MWLILIKDILLDILTKPNAGTHIIEEASSSDVGFSVGCIESCFTNSDWHYYLVSGLI